MIQLLVSGIVWGSILTLGGIGLSLTYGIMGFANFAHGDIMALGAFLSYWIMTSLRQAFFQAGGSFGPLSFGWPLLFAFLCSAVLTVLGTLLIDRLVYKRLRKAGSVVLLISSIGISFTLRNVLLFIWGPQSKSYFESIQMMRKIPGIPAKIRPDEIFIVACALILSLLLHFFLKYTKAGKAMRATSVNPNLARSVGIDTERVITWTWTIGAVLATAAGTLAAVENRFITPSLGWHMLLPLFAAVILGGIGSPYGAILGGIVIALSQQLSTPFISAAYKPAVAFVIMIFFLFVKPTGLMGRR